MLFTHIGPGLHKSGRQAQIYRQEQMYRQEQRSKRITLTHTLSPCRHKARVTQKNEGSKKTNKPANNREESRQTNLGRAAEE